MKLFKKIAQKIISLLGFPYRIVMLKREIKKGIPYEIQGALIFLVTGKVDKSIKEISNNIETERKKLSRKNGDPIKIYYSPKPGSAGDNPEEVKKVKPGEIKEFSLEQIARTGKNKKWGIVLNLLSRDSKAKYGVELGTCAGFSAMYLSMTNIMEKLITVEGSSELYQLAKSNLSEFKNVKIENCLFDEAISERIGEFKGILDLAYIDGHHEKVATLHYFDKLLPYMSDQCLVIFDDISWSQDMRDCWNELTQRKEFLHCFDLGAIGVGLVDKNQAQSMPKNWHFQSLLGKVKVSQPHGWS